jgi:transcriptional regulator with XRE-family HTH domain
MHHFPYPSYLRTHRKRWELTQPELGALLGGLSASLISKYETLARTPNVEALIGTEFIFGEPARRLFPGLYASVETAVTLRAVDFAEAVGATEDKSAQVKRDLLEAIAVRAASETSSI